VWALYHIQARKEKHVDYRPKKLTGRRPLGKIRHILLDNIKTDLMEIDCEDMYYTVSSLAVMAKNLSFHNNSKIT